MTSTSFAEGQVLFREGDPADSVFRLISGSIDILRELDGQPILLGTVGAGQFIGEMGVLENRTRSATARAASEVEVEILTPAEFFDQIANSPPAARELIQRLSQRLREADDRIVNDERRSASGGSFHGRSKRGDCSHFVGRRSESLRFQQCFGALMGGTRAIPSQARISRHANIANVDLGKLAQVRCANLGLVLVRSYFGLCLFFTTQPA